MKSHAQRSTYNPVLVDFKETKLDVLQNLNLNYRYTFQVPDADISDNYVYAINLDLNGSTINALTPGITLVSVSTVDQWVISFLDFKQNVLVKQLPVSRLCSFLNNGRIRKFNFDPRLGRNIRLETCFVENIAQVRVNSHTRFMFQFWYIPKKELSPL